MEMSKKQIESAIEKIVAKPLEDLKKKVWGNMQKFAKKIDELDLRIKELEERRE